MTTNQLLQIGTKLSGVAVVVTSLVGAPADDLSRPRSTMLGRSFRPRASRHDLTAGVVLGVQSVPDGLATGLLAGLNPMAGL